MPTILRCRPFGSLGTSRCPAWEEPDEEEEEEEEDDRKEDDEDEDTDDGYSE